MFLGDLIPRAGFIILRMSEIRNDEVKNIGDAGDSSRDETDDDFSSPVNEIVSCIRRVLQCGDHQGLKIHLGRLEEWKRSGQMRLTHDYWKVAQYLGETELNNICLLLTVTFDKPESIRWCYLGDVLSLLSLTMSNRETIFRLLVHTSTIVPILVEAIQQQVQEDARLHALTTVNLLILVCRSRFAKALTNCHFLHRLVDSVTRQDVQTSPLLLEKLLQVIKSLLMCGQTCLQNYANEILNNISYVMQCPVGQRHLLNFYHELVRSTDRGEKPYICVRYWTKGRLRKELLSKCLGQPWLYIYCSWPACGHHNATPNTFFRKCSACNAVRYSFQTVSQEKNR
ncbi:hypothetical protein Btru_001010 [Bulinus truncatus]|nr:hypothetical protein Btru_001010 [Bulinus truncatus]